MSYFNSYRIDVGRGYSVIVHSTEVSLCRRFSNDSHAFDFVVQGVREYGVGDFVFYGHCQNGQWFIVDPSTAHVTLFQLQDVWKMALADDGVKNVILLKPDRSQSVEAKGGLSPASAAAGFVGMIAVLVMAACFWKLLNDPPRRQSQAIHRPSAAD